MSSPTQINHIQASSCNLVTDAVPIYDQPDTFPPSVQDPITYLKELVDAHTITNVSYHFTKSGPDHCPLFSARAATKTKYGAMQSFVHAPSKKAAKRSAASQLLTRYLSADRALGGRSVPGRDTVD